MNLGSDITTTTFPLAIWLLSKASTWHERARQTPNGAQNENLGCLGACSAQIEFDAEMFKYLMTFGRELQKNSRFHPTIMAWKVEYSFILKTNPTPMENLDPEVRWISGRYPLDSHRIFAGPENHKYPRWISAHWPQTGSRRSLATNRRRSHPICG